MFGMVKENLMNAVKAGRKGLEKSGKAVSEMGGQAAASMRGVADRVGEAVYNNPMKAMGVAAGAGAVGAGVPAAMAAQQQGYGRGQEDMAQQQQSEALMQAVQESVDAERGTLSWSKLHKNLAKINKDAANNLTLEHVQALTQELGQEMGAALRVDM